jgi:SAM-dependent methyltransferase
MDEKHLSELCLKEANYWWHVNRRQLLLSFLDRRNLSKCRILEVGCGGGLLSSLLLQAGADVVSADILTNAIRAARRKGGIKVLAFDAGHPWPFAPHSFEIIIMLDVLEHIENDVGCLYEVRRVLRKDGRAVLSVPAHQFLFSSWDKVVGHYRRYSKARLRRIFSDVGLQPVIFSYQNALSFIPALALRGKDRLTGGCLKHAEFPDIPETVNKLLKWWGRLESTLIPLKLPIGLSIFAVLKSD